MPFRSSMAGVGGGVHIRRLYSLPYVFADNPGLVKAQSVFPLKSRIHQDLQRKVDEVKELPSQARRLSYHPSWDKTSKALRNRLFFALTTALSGIGDAKGTSGFLNYGFALPGKRNSFPLLSDLSIFQLPSLRDKLSAQLYHVCCTLGRGGNDSKLVATQASLRKNIVQNKHVLDVGCFKGGGVAYIKTHLGARSVVGVDFSKQCIRHCRKRYVNMENVDFVHADAMTLNEVMPWNSFDVITCIQSARHFADAGYFFQIAHDLLKPHGCLIVADKWKDELLEAEDIDPDDDADERLNLIRHLLTVGFLPSNKEDLTEGFARSHETRWSRSVCSTDRFIVVRSLKDKSPSQSIEGETLHQHMLGAMIFGNTKPLQPDENYFDYKRRRGLTFTK